MKIITFLTLLFFTNPTFAFRMIYKCQSSGPISFTYTERNHIMNTSETLEVSPRREDNQNLVIGNHDHLIWARYLGVDRSIGFTWLKKTSGYGYLPFQDHMFTFEVGSTQSNPVFIDAIAKDRFGREHNVSCEIRGLKAN